MINFSGDEPWAYRIIVPLAAEGLRKVLVRHTNLQKRRAREYSYLIWRFVFTWPFLVLFHGYLTRWVPPPWAVAGVMWVISLHVFSYNNYWYQPASPLNLLLWLLAAEMTLSRDHRWLFLLILLGAFNRETSVFIVLIHVALMWGQEPRRALILRSLGLLVVWAAVYGGLRWMIDAQGSASPPIAKLMRFNLSAEWFFYASCFLAQMMLFPIIGWRRVPINLRWLMVGLLPYLGLVVFFGRVREVRLMLPLTIALIPASLIILRQQLTSSTPTADDPDADAEQDEPEPDEPRPARAG